MLGFICISPVIKAVFIHHRIIVCFQFWAEDLYSDISLSSTPFEDLISWQKPNFHYGFTFLLPSSLADFHNYTSYSVNISWILSSVTFWSKPGIPQKETKKCEFCSLVEVVWKGNSEKRISAPTSFVHSFLISNYFFEKWEVGGELSPDCPPILSYDLHVYKTYSNE